MAEITRLADGHLYLDQDPGHEEAGTVDLNDRVFYDADGNGEIGQGDREIPLETYLRGFNFIGPDVLQYAEITPRFKVRDLESYVAKIMSGAKGPRGIADYTNGYVGNLYKEVIGLGIVVDVVKYPTWASIDFSVSPRQGRGKSILSVIAHPKEDRGPLEVDQIGIIEDYNGTVGGRVFTDFWRVDSALKDEGYAWRRSPEATPGFLRALERPENAHKVLAVGGDRLRLVDPNVANVSTLFNLASRALHEADQVKPNFKTNMGEEIALRIRDLSDLADFNF